MRVEASLSTMKAKVELTPAELQVAIFHYLKIEKKIDATKISFNLDKAYEDRPGGSYNLVLKGATVEFELGK